MPPEADPIFDNGAVVGYLGDGFITMTDARLWMLIAVMLFFGFGAGFFVGQWDAIRNLFKRYPNARADLIAAGYRDPARAWWKPMPSTVKRWGIFVGFYGVVALGFVIYALTLR